MYKYLDIINVSIFLTSLYMILSNLMSSKYKKVIFQAVIIISIIVLKLSIILNVKNLDDRFFYNYISDLMSLIFLVQLDLYNVNKKYKKYILVLNYLFTLSLLFLNIHMEGKLYSTIIDIYVLMINLYLISAYIFKKRFKIKYLLYFIYFGQVFAQLILVENIYIRNISTVISLLSSIHILVKVFRLYVKNYYDKSIDIISKINRSNINIKMHEEKLNLEKVINQDINAMINKKEKLLDLIFSNSKKCMFLINSEGYIVNEDISFYKVWDEYVGYEYDINLEFFYKNSLCENLDFLHNIETCKKIFKEIECEIEDKKGRIFNYKYVPVKLNDSKIMVVCIMTDITYIKKIEMKIRDNDTKYKKIIDNMPYSVLITNKEEILYNNNKNDYIDFNKDDIKNIILGDYPNKELYYTHTNGIDACLSIDKISYTDNDFKNLLIIKDITSYKNLLRKIEHSKNKYESLVNIIPEGIYVLDFENKSLKYANNAFLKMLGTDNISQIDIENLNKNIIITSGNMNDTVKYRKDTIINNYGENINIEYGGMLLNVDKNIKMIGIVRDITEQVKSEIIEKDIQEKEMLNKSKNEFFINMSHELKTPLNLIHSSNQLIESVYKKELEENNNIEILDSINIVKKHVNILMTLIDNIIELAKLQSDFHHIEKDYYNIVDISEDIVDEFANFIRDEDINIVFDTDEEEKIANVDPNDIEKVILMLLSIVVKYSNKNSNINFELSSRNSFIIMKIKNTGGYDYNKYINDSERKVLDISLTLAKLIMDLYEGSINIKTEPNNIEINVSLKIDYDIKFYKTRIKSKQEGFVYSEYKKICSF